MKTLITSFFMFASVIIFGQTCTIDYSMTSPGVSPTALPNGKIGVPYQGDVTLYFPQDDGNGHTYSTFTIESVELPLGLTWLWSQENTGSPFDPQMDPFTCMQFHGTPAEAGSFTVIITAKGILSDGSTAPYTFSPTITIDSSFSTTAYFTLSPSIGCDNVTVSFTPENLSNYSPVAGLTNGISHQWDFGNGNQSTDSVPNPQTYSSPGDYIVTYTRIFDTIGFKLQNIKITGVGSTDATGYGEPDLYIQLIDGSGSIVYNTESSPNDADLPQTYSVNQILDNPPYTIRVMDDDSDNLWGTDDDNAIDGNENTNTTSFPLPSINNYNLTTLSGGSGSLTFTYDIQKDTSHVISHDTVHVYASPAAPVITSTPSPLTLSTTDMGFVYHWFNNSNRMFQFKGASIQPSDGGNYTVMVVDDHGCTALSDPMNVDFTGLEAYTSTSFKLFPNPASSIVQVQFEQNLKQASIKVIDVTGRVVSQQKLENSNSAVLSVQGLANGIYTIAVQEDKQQVTTKKIVVTH